MGGSLLAMTSLGVEHASGLIAIGSFFRASGGRGPLFPIGDRGGSPLGNADRWKVGRGLLGRFGRSATGSGGSGRPGRSGLLRVEEVPRLSRTWLGASRTTIVLDRATTSLFMLPNSVLVVSGIASRSFSCSCGVA